MVAKKRTPAKSLKAKPKVVRPQKKVRPSAATRATKKVVKTKPHKTNRKIKKTLHIGRYTITLDIKISPKAKSRVRERNKYITIFSQYFRFLWQKKSAAFALVYLALGAYGIILFGSRIVQSQSLSSPIEQPESRKVSKPELFNKSLSASNAIRLRIKGIAVDAPVNLVGKQPDGTVQVPSNPGIIGQYEFAPTPGEIGPAIMVGHVDSIKGPAVFWRLRELAIGDSISVERKDGTTANFKVSKIKEYSQTDFPTKIVYGNTEHAELRLITCGGTFNILKQRYSKNTVVFATLQN